MKTLFWLSIFVLFYAYAGYPLLMWMMSCLPSARRKKNAAPYFPKVSLLISAYNEEKTIEDKILNSLSLNYPKKMLDIIVISDGSTDRTDEIVRKYEDRGVSLKCFEGRIGKTACLNKVVPVSRGHVIVFSDANSTYDKDAVKGLVANFADDKIGFVTGYTRYAVDRENETSASIGIYARIERFTKRSESKIGSCVGADGALFAIRKQLYKPLADSDINDFVIPLDIVRQGFRGVLEETAFCMEKTAGDSKGEFKRQIRITNRTLRALFKNVGLLNPITYGIFAFELFSHKVAKFLAPFFAISLVFCTTALSHAGAPYRLFLLAQVLIAALAWLGHGTSSAGIFPRVSSLCSTFATTNLAILGGWFQFVKGETYTTWSPAKR